jgi:hypothetical protein
MPPVESALWRREPGPAGGRLELCLLRVDVACHQDISASHSEEEVKCLKDTVKGAFLSIAEHWGGKLFSSNDDGSVIAFPGGGDDSFNNCCSAAIQMLEMVPALNQDFRPSVDVGCPIDAHLCCDAGTVTPGPGLSGAVGEVVNKLMQHRLHPGGGDGVTITDRVYSRLAAELKAQFERRHYSAELEAELYSTPSAEPEAEGHNPGQSLQPRAEVPPRKTERLRGLVAGRVKPWAKGAAAVLVGLLAVLLVARAVTVPRAPAPPPGSDESLRADEWTVWRKHVQQKLAAAPQRTEDEWADALRTRSNDVRLQLELRQLEEAVVEALKNRPARPADPPAAALRHDQAVADVLLADGGVRFLLWWRLGIDKQFLGTGLSRPGGDHDYSTAAVHEYLIRNYRDSYQAVWTWQLQPVAPHLLKPVRQILAGEGDQKVGRIPPTLDRTGTFEESLTGVILPHLKSRSAIMPPVIRFAKFPASRYENTVGRPGARRVFASNLAEVWDLPLQEAARLSGYTFGTASPKGDTFFIWIFVPAQESEVVPATWGQVLDNLPAWLKEGES